MFSCTEHGVRLHAALEQNTRTNTLEIGEVDAAFASQLRIFDRPR